MAGRECIPRRFCPRRHYMRYGVDTIRAPLGAYLFIGRVRGQRQGLRSVVVGADPATPSLGRG